MRKLVSLILAALYLSAFLYFGFKSFHILRPFLYNPYLTIEQTRLAEEVAIGPNHSEFPRIELSAVRLGSPFRLLPAHVVYREEVIRLRYLPLKDASATEAMSVSGSESPNTLNNVPVADLSLENAKILETLFSRSWNNDERKPTKVQFNVRGLRIEGVTGADSRLKTITLFFSTDSAALTGLEIQRFAAKLQTLLKGQ